MCPQVYALTPDTSCIKTPSSLSWITQSLSLSVSSFSPCSTQPRPVKCNHSLFLKRFSGFSYHQMKSPRALIHPQGFPSDDPRFLLPSPHSALGLSSEDHSQPLEGSRTCSFLCISSRLWQFQDSLPQHSSDLSLNVLATPSPIHTFKLTTSPNTQSPSMFYSSSIHMLFSIILCISIFIFFVDYFHNLEYKLHECLK